jgi:phosphate acetyltransferase
MKRVAAFLRNRTFDELQIGNSASIVRVVGLDDIDLFAAVSVTSIRHI